MADAVYRPSKAGWDAIALSPQIQAACVAEAERGKPFAQSISPVRSGEYKSRFRVEPATVAFRRGPRVAARLVNDAKHAAAVEFGNRRGGPARVLGKTAAFLGGSG